MLVRARGGDEGEPHPFPLGAALTVGNRAWVLVEDAADDGRGFGAALVWALRHGATELDVVAEHGTGVMARRAGEFALPIHVWEPDGTELRPAVAEPAGLVSQPDSRHLALIPDIEAAGATAVIEHAAVTGEVRGLEVCRVVTVDGDDGQIIRLEVGVGVHDREAFTMIHGDVPTHEALAGVVRSVAAVRDVGVPGHPLNRLAPERFVRWQLEQQPGLLDLVSVEPAEPPVPRLNLKDRSPCVALGRRADGSRVVVVPSVGVDLDLIPYAVDARLALGGPGIGVGDSDLEVLVVAPSRDLVAVTHELAGALRHSVTLVPSPTSAGAANSD